MATPDEEKKIANEVLLTQRMRSATKEVHDQSDKLVNLKLSMVLTSKNLYAEAISLFWPIYAELEALLEKHKDHEQLRMLHTLLPVLQRASRFEDDMKALLVEGDLVEELKQRRVSKVEKQKVYSPPELQAYIENLRQLSENDPIVLVAYVSAMYGAIMAGGAMIKRMVKKAYSIKNEEGVQIFIIDANDDFPNSKKVSNEMKRIINMKMKLTEEEKRRIISESSKVFARNNALVATIQNTAVFAAATRHFLLYFGIAVSGLFLAIYAFA